jgi:hypothetical protein
MKTLNTFLEQTGYLKVKSPDEQKFVDKHEVVVKKDNNGNEDDVFKASKIKPVDRRKERKGYNPGEDEKVYEDVEIQEAMDAADRFNHHHQHAKNLLKSINQHLKTQAAEAAAHKDSKGRKGPNWGHTGSMEHVANQLSNIHDQLARTGEYRMHEEVELDEKTLTPAELKKREEVAKAVERENPKMPMGKKMAIATSTAKRVAEETLPGLLEDLSDYNRNTMLAVFDKLSDENKTKFVEACETPAGVEAMLDFAIQNRGK